MAIKQREYLLTTNRFKEPDVVTAKNAIGLLLVRLIMMEPGTNPLHPDMGVGIVRYRYGMENHEELRKRVEDQIATYLPYYSDAKVSLVYCEDHTLNIEITINDTTYVYESASSPVPIGLSDMNDEE